MTASSFSFELTLSYDQNYNDFNWSVFDFEHKQIKTLNYEKVMAFKPKSDL